MAHDGRLKTCSLSPINMYKWVPLGVFDHELGVNLVPLKKGTLYTMALCIFALLEDMLDNSQTLRVWSISPTITGVLKTCFELKSIVNPFQMIHVEYIKAFNCGNLGVNLVGKGHTCPTKE